MRANPLPVDINMGVDSMMIPITLSGPISVSTLEFFFNLDWDLTVLTLTQKIDIDEYGRQRPR
jgi:hypothetical protein